MIPSNSFPFCPVIIMDLPLSCSQKYSFDTFDTASFQHQMFDLPMSMAMGEDMADGGIDLPPIIDLVGDEIPQYFDEPGHMAIDLAEAILFPEYIDEPVAIDLVKEIPIRPLARFAEIDPMEARDLAVGGKRKSKNIEKWATTIFDDW